VLDIRKTSPDAYIEMEDEMSLVAEPVVQYMNADQLHKAIETTRKKMLEASKETDYLSAAKLRDEMLSLQKTLKEKFQQN
jgi:excinuclease ABC subunit B